MSTWTPKCSAASLWLIFLRRRAMNSDSPLVGLISGLDIPVFPSVRVSAPSAPSQSHRAVPWAHGPGTPQRRVRQTTTTRTRRLSTKPSRCRQRGGVAGNIGFSTRTGWRPLSKGRRASHIAPSDMLDDLHFYTHHPRPFRGLDHTLAPLANPVWSAP